MAASMILRNARRLSLCNIRSPTYLQSVYRLSTDADDGTDSDKKESKFSFSLDEPMDEKTDEIPKTTTTIETTPEPSTPLPPPLPRSEPVVAPTFYTAKRTAVKEPPKTFASMLRQSTLMMMGDFKKARLKGHIIEVQDDDLYIDFGGKFYCVCPRPEPKDMYYKGRLVDIQLLEWEMSQKFIGSEKHITLLEADAILLGLSRSGGQSEEDLLANENVKSEDSKSSGLSEEDSLIKENVKSEDTARQ